jgi:hypothetical protein
MTRDGYGQAYQRGFDLTLRFLVSRSVHRDSAKEVAQAAWVTWVNMIALSVYPSLIGREPINQMLLDQPDKTVGIDLAAIDIARILTFCRPSNRHLLEQCMNGVTTAEIGREQGVSETAIRIRLPRARRDARSRVEKKWFAPRRSRNTFVVAGQSAA